MLTVMGPEALISGLHSLLNHTINCVSNCTHGKSQHILRDRDTRCSPTFSSSVSPSPTDNLRYSGPFQAVKKQQPSTFGVFDPALCLGDT